MVDEGTIIGTTKSGVSSRPGETAAAYYHGNVQSGFQMVTYLSSVDTYQVTPRNHHSSTNAYSASIYEVQGGSDHTRLYLSVYGDNGVGELASGGLDVSVLLFGNQ